MRFDILTLFPEMIEQGLQHSIMKRAREKGVYEAHPMNFRDFSKDKFHRVDDAPYGGGAGMVIQIQPVDDALNSLDLEPGTPVVYTTPKGKPFNQKMAEQFAQMPRMVFLCGHYEGLDQRIIDKWVTHEVSIGDFVLTGGELPVLMMMDAVIRLREGALGDDASVEEESFSNGLLEYPHYTRPATYEDREIPPILMSGHHEKIAQWRLLQSLILTAQRRPELFQKYISDSSRTKAEKKVIQSALEAMKSLRVDE